MTKETVAMITQAIITVGVILTICVMTGLEREVPKEMWALAGTVLGWLGANGLRAVVEWQTIREAKKGRPNDFSQYH